MLPACCWRGRRSTAATLSGRDAHVPGVFAGLTPEQVIHSTHSVPRIAAFHKDMAHRVVVVGVPQNAARCSRRCRSTCRLSRPTMVMRLIGLSTYESSKFTNKLYSRPSFCSTREITVQCPE